MPPDRERAGEAGFGGQGRPFPFRQGPVPVCYTAENAAELRKLVVEKIRLFVEEQGYDPEPVFAEKGQSGECWVHSSCIFPRSNLNLTHQVLTTVFAVKT
jgi:hypothetical protein